MEKEYSLGNILKNMTRKQKIALSLVILIIIALLIILFTLISMPYEGSGGVNEDDGVGAANEGETVEENGITGEELITGNSDGDNSVMVPVSVDYNEDHEYALIDYIPISKYDYMTYGDNQHGVRAYWVINENTAIDKGIVVSVDSCDVEGNNAAANEYLKSLPVDLSDYIIIYRVHEGNIPCDIKK